MNRNRTILLGLSGLCVLAGLALGFLGFTGQQGVGFMGLGAAMCLALSALGLVVGLQSSAAWWVRTLLALDATALSLACGATMVLALTGKDFAHASEFWSLHASKLALCVGCGMLIVLAASIGAVAHGIRTVRTSDPLGPLDWNTQGDRYRAGLATGNVKPAQAAHAAQFDKDQATKRFVPGFTPIAPSERTPAGSEGGARQTPSIAGQAAPSSVPDGVLPQGMRAATGKSPTALSSRVPVLGLAAVAMLAIAGAGGLWLVVKGPRQASASQAPITTSETKHFAEWGFGFDVPGAPFEKIDPSQFSSRAVLAVTRKEPAMRFYVIAERRSDARTLEESARLLREAMTDIAPNATTLLDNKAQVAGIDGWRLLTRVRVGSTDTFYCHWLGELQGVSLQLWVVGTGRDAQSFAREADTLFDRFFILRQSTSAQKSSAEAPAASDEAVASPEAQPHAKPDAKPAPTQARPRPTTPNPQPAQPSGGRPASVQPGRQTQPPRAPR
jgi:hypothetical protein